MDWQRGKIPFFVSPPDSEEYIKAQKDLNNVDDVNNANDKVSNKNYKFLV